MSDTTLEELPPFAGHSPDQERPLGGYVLLMGSFLTLCGGFSVWLHRSGKELPERVESRDLALIATATFKASRILARDRVTSAIRAPFSRFQGDAGPGEVDEAARGRGVRRVLGELLVCPYCLDVWTASAFLAGLVAAPAETRWVASALSVVAAADALQIAYARAEAAL
ncbi:MAG: DUF1360 domain-containing protein [Solirubrobacterales bacterium]|nr:DUF1360 domain-containing protein [Solirubrobacterales bacterium]MBV9534174.1 DUF1360 domain-containing protein [Solirubrobacterales bacterium]